MAAAAEVPYYYASLDFEALWREFPPPPSYFDTTYRKSADEIRALQNHRLKQQVARCWEIPFYQRHWGQAGIKPGDIQTVDDLRKLPTFAVSDLRDSIDRAPPFGDYMGVDPKNGPPTPWVMQTSGGTTGLPRPILYTPRDREVTGILGARRLFMAGIRAGDLVQTTHSLGLSNAGLSTREAVWKYSGAVPVMTGSGAGTPTRQQIEIAKAWKIRALIGFPAYLRHMALVARDELKIDPREMNVRIIGTHLGTDDRRELEELWNAKVYDSYGANEAGMMAADCSERNGMHIFEDTHFIEIVDPETGAAVPEGQRGTVYVTCLFKHAAPMIRFNINDVSAFASGTCACGGTHRRIQGIFGRSDNMVKLRGVNVFPEAIGTLLGGDKRTTGEYLCVVEPSGPSAREEMTVMIETSDGSVEKDAVQAHYERRFKDALGVKMTVQVVDRGALDQLTGLTRTSKIKRLIDKRKK